MLRLFCVLVFLCQSTLYAKTTKEIWQNYAGIADCKSGYCADGIPPLPLELILNYLHNNTNLIYNTNYIAIADFRLPSTKKRLFILNLKDGSVDSMLVAHGKKTEGTLAMAENFSNEPGSEMSSLGFYLTDEIPYKGKHGIALRLEGLSKTNSNALQRAIVFHSADYVSEWFINQKNRLGLSLGCPAVPVEKIESVITKMKDHGLLLIYSDQFLLDN